MPGPVTAVADNAAQAQAETEASQDGQRAQPAGARGGGFFARKYGPLKGWQWSAAAGGAALAYFWWRSRRKAQATGTAVTGTGSGTGYAGQISALQDEIDQMQGGSSVTGTGGGGGGAGTGTSATGSGGGGGSTGTAATGTSKTATGGGKTPGAPGSPHMARVGTWAARAAWTPPKGGAHVVAYEVIRSGAGVNTTTGTQHSFTALKPGTHYTWKVRALGTGGASPWASGSFTTKPKNKK